MHAIESMSPVELIEMELEWSAVVEEMNLRSILQPKGFEFSRKMFAEAYSRGYMKAKTQNKTHNGTETQPTD